MIAGVTLKKEVTDGDDERDGVEAARRAVGSPPEHLQLLEMETGARRRRRPQRGVAVAKRSAPPPAFVPVRITAGPLPLGAAAGLVPSDGEVAIALGRARRVRVRGRVDPAWLVQVLHGLEARGC